MTAEKLAVYQVVPAKNQAVWINTLLSPVLVAIRAAGRPIELRPTGKFGGWSAGACRKRNPDGRISVSSHAPFWSRTGFVCVYTHELSHCLVEEVEPGVFHSHDACFFALNLALLLRLDAIQYIASDAVTDWANSVDLYDLGDPPDCWCDVPVQVWKPRAIGWAMRTAYEVFAADLTAEQLAVLICERYRAWSLAMQLEPQNTVLAQANAAAKNKRISDARAKLVDDLQLYKWLTWLMGAAFLTVVYAFARIRGG